MTDTHLFRVGQNINKIRHLVVKLGKSEVKSNILFLAKGLKSFKKWSGVSITHDLTKLQCQEEKLKEVELRSKADDRNCHLSAAERSQKIWRVVGGRGTRSLALRDVQLDRHK